MAKKTGPKPQPNKAILIEELLALRKPTVPGPSLVEYQVYPKNFSRTALDTGSLPTVLQETALMSETEKLEYFKSDPEQYAIHCKELSLWHDSLVRSVIISPDLTDVDLDVLPPEDYDWALAVAQGEETLDGLGNKIIGVREGPSLNEKYATFPSGADSSQSGAAHDQGRDVPDGQ